MAKRNWTEEQLGAIRATDRTVLLSAAAGSGKTAVLTERLIACVTREKDPLNLSRVLACTFTRAAAGELRERIGAALSRAVAERPTDPYLKRQLLLLPMAQFSTIDSFCITLLRRYGAEAGVPLGFRLSDEQESDLLRLEVMEEIFERGYSGELTGVSREAFCRLVSHFADLKGERDLPMKLCRFVKRLEALQRGVDALEEHSRIYEEAAKRPLADTLWGEELHRCFASFGSHYAPAFSALMAEPDAGELHPKLLSAMQFALALCDTLRSPLDYTGLRTVLVGAKLPALPQASKAYPETPLSEKMKGLYRTFRDAVKGRITPRLTWEEADWSHLFEALSVEIHTLWGVLKEFEDRLMARCRKKGAFDFAQTTRLAYSMLVKDGAPTPLAKQLGEDYDAVCIDEYQDVNPLQHAIFEAIARPGCRFMVGDIKQSIYRFRYAEPDIFASLRASLPPLADNPEAKAVSHFMSCNFRSEKPVIDFINAVFSFLFGGAGASIGYCSGDDLRLGLPENTRLPKPTVAIFDPKAEGAAEAPVASELPTLDEAPADEQEGEQSAEGEALWVATEIGRLLQTGTRGDGITPLRPGDFAILMRSAKEKHTPFAAALARLGIPCILPENTSFFSSPEVLLALSLLNTVDNPGRDIHLAATLCSPLYGFTADDLTRLRLETGEGLPLYDALCQYCEAHPDFAPGHTFLTQLSEFRDLAEKVPVDALLRHLYTATPLEAIAGRENPGGENNLKLLHHYARAYAGKAYAGLYSFIHFVNSQIENNTTFRPPSGGAPEEAVTISTIHASKGLEYPVVFLCGAGSTFSHRDASDTLLLDGDSPLAFNMLEESGQVKIQNPVSALMGHTIRERNTQEELRLLYVALTRAKERLYVTGTLSGKTTYASHMAHVTEAAQTPDEYSILTGLQSYLAMVQAALETNPEAGTLLYCPQPEAQADAATPGQDATPDGQRAEEVMEELRARLDYTYGHTPATTLPKKLSVSHIHPGVNDGTAAETTPLPTPKEETGSAEKFRRLPVAFAGERPPDPTKRGIATHQFMQFCDFRRLKELGVEAEIQRLKENGYLLEEDVALIRLEELKTFRTSPLLDAFCSARAVHREQRFNLKLPAAPLFATTPEEREILAEEEVLLQGVMDAVIVHPDGEITLVDYKTDRLTRAELSNPALAEKKLLGRHAAQMQYYAIAAEQIFGRRPGEVLLYVLHSGRTISLPSDLDIGGRA